MKSDAAPLRIRTESGALTACSLTSDGLNVPLFSTGFACLAFGVFSALFPRRGCRSRRNNFDERVAQPRCTVRLDSQRLDVLVQVTQAVTTVGPSGHRPCQRHSKSSIWNDVGRADVPKDHTVVTAVCDLNKRIKPLGIQADCATGLGYTLVEIIPPGPTTTTRKQGKKTPNAKQAKPVKKAARSAHRKSKNRP